MRYVSVNRGLRPQLLRLSAFAALVAAVCAVMGIAPSGAKAEPVTFQLDRGVINLGGEEAGLWANLIDPNLDPPDPASTITVDVAEDGTLTGAADDFYFPPKRIEDLETGNGLLPLVDANVAIGAEGPISGNFDIATGSAEVTIPADVLMTIYAAGSPVSVARCRIDGFNLEFSTGVDTMSDPGDAEADPPRPPADYESAEFEPPEGDGAMIARWASLPVSDNEGGSLGGIVCPALDEMLGGPGGVWMSGIAGTDVDPPPPPAPTQAPKLTGTPASSTESTNAEFQFVKGDAETSQVAGFECKLDAGQFEDCSTGSVSYTGLALGTHTFTVRAVNPSGAGPESAPFSWEIKKTEECPAGTNGTPPDCGSNKKPRLGALKAQPKTKSVKRGKKAVVKVKVRNVGQAVAQGVRVCVKAPKRLVRVRKCVKVGKVGPRTTKTARFVVSAKRKRGAAVLKFVATSSNAGRKSVKAVVKVK